MRLDTEEALSIMKELAESRTAETEHWRQQAQVSQTARDEAMGEAGQWQHEAQLAQEQVGVLEHRLAQRDREATELQEQVKRLTQVQSVYRYVLSRGAPDLAARLRDLRVLDVDANATAAVVAAGGDVPT